MTSSISCNLPPKNSTSKQVSKELFLDIYPSNWTLAQGYTCASVWVIPLFTSPPFPPILHQILGIGISTLTCGLHIFFEACVRKLPHLIQSILSTFVPSSSPLGTIVLHPTSLVLTTNLYTYTTINWCCVLPYLLLLSTSLFLSRSSTPTIRIICVLIIFVLGGTYLTKSPPN